MVASWDMTAPQSSSDYLKVLRTDLEDLVATAKERLAPLDPEALLQRPTPDSWSVAECLAHLMATNAGYLASIDEALRRSPATPGIGHTSFRGGRLAAWFIRQSGPEVPRKSKAPRVFAPKDADVGPGVVAAYLEQQREIDRLLVAAEGAGLMRIKVPSPASRLIRLRLGDAFRLMVEHERRHVLQAIRVLDTPGAGHA